MPVTKREPGPTGITKAEPQKLKESSKIKAERPPSRVQAEPRSVKAEQHVGGVKAEQRVSVKAEQRVGVKAENRVGVKLEQPARVKAESGAAASSGSGAKLPPLSAKVEQLRNVGVARIKAELLKQEQGNSIQDLVARQLQMRAKEQKVKREKGTRGRIKNLVKVKKERPRNKDGKLRKKPRTTAKKRKASREVMAREVALSQELGDLLGAEALSRPETVRRLWAYCRDNNMLNPSNKREIQFDTKLESMMGQSKATMPQLISLLMPHFDYTKPVVKQETKQEPGSRGRALKVEAKKEQLQAAKREATTKKEMKLETKLEAKLEAKLEMKKEEHIAKRAKLEPTSGLLDEAMKPAALETLRATVPQISSFESTTAVIECVAPPGNSQLDAVAVPNGLCKTSRSELRVTCKVDFREDKNGVLKPFAEARFTGLDPKLSYSITLQLLGYSEGCSHEVCLPQRACPAKWSSRDVMLWCQTQHVPELVRMTQDYAINGSTLISLGEEDLRASGVVAPFLLRRTLNALAALRAAGS